MPKLPPRKTLPTKPTQRLSRELLIEVIEKTSNLLNQLAQELRRQNMFPPPGPNTLTGDDIPF